MAHHNTNSNKALKILLVILIVILIALCMGISLFIFSHDDNAVEFQNNNDFIPIEQIQDTPVPAEELLAYPTGWLITNFSDGANEVPAFTPLELIYLPDFEIAPTYYGQATSDVINDVDVSSLSDGECVIRYQDQYYTVKTNNLLLNAPDIFGNNMEYDAVYSYGAPSRCNGEEIPGLTGYKLDGYVDGKQDDEFLSRAEYCIPIAYNTAVKMQSAADALYEQGYKIKLWDVYRPRQGSAFLYEKFLAACNQSPSISQEANKWGIGWYAATSASSHNFAAAIDATLTTLDGTEVTMPSQYDAFDESAHLSSSPISAGTITEETYADSVKNNQTCLLFHRIMKTAGFSELASEWWHFDDSASKQYVQSIVGSQGMNFIASPFQKQ